MLVIPVIYVIILCSGNLTQTIHSIGTALSSFPHHSLFQAIWYCMSNPLLSGPNLYCDVLPICCNKAIYSAYIRHPTLCFQNIITLLFSAIRSFLHVLPLVIPLSELPICASLFLKILEYNAVVILCPSNLYV